MVYRQHSILIFKFGLLLSIVFFAGKIQSQSLIRQSLSSLGGSNSSSGITLQSSVGQSSNTINQIQTTGSLRQGFIQPPSQNSVYAKVLPSVLIYPNPSTGLFHIKMDFEAGDYFVVNTILGAKITERRVLSNYAEQTFNIQGNAEGIYIITVFRDNQTIKTTKIVLSK